MIPLSLEAVAAAIGGRLCDVPDASVLMTAPAVVDSRTSGPAVCSLRFPVSTLTGMPSRRMR
ncbi:hypothetical protein AB0467_12410 [Streptomyces sp. NPDC052095]|uniref:hypothetical protein n=1 Tax=unclassified Streptomyces TaxID=2593676 RepID=UPI0034503B6D